MIYKFNISRASDGSAIFDPFPLQYGTARAINLALSSAGTPSSIKGQFSVPIQILPPMEIAKVANFVCSAPIVLTVQTEFSGIYLTRWSNSPGVAGDQVPPGQLKNSVQT